MIIAEQLNSRSINLGLISLTINSFPGMGPYVGPIAPIGSVEPHSLRDIDFRWIGTVILKADLKVYNWHKYQ